MQLRDYQQTSIERVKEDWERVKSTLLVLPTGTGKTIVFTKLTEDLVRNLKGRVLILAHREELINQAADKLQIATGLDCAIEKAKNTAQGSWFNITIGSVQTLCNQKRLERFEPDHYQYIIIDEAHHALSPSYTRIFDYFCDAKLLGVTATPDRGDKKNLGKVFESLAFEYSLHDAISNGYLSKISAVTIPLEINLGKVGTQAGDFKAGDLDDALMPYMESIADEMATYCKDRKTIVFLPLIATSQKMTELLNQRGFRASEVNGMSKDRKEILADFHNDKYNVICNSMLLTEGYDEPSVDCIVCLRPTKVRALYCQIVGRGTRPHPGKENLLVLDFLWHTEKHELCRPAHLVASNQDVAKKVQEIMEKKPGGQLEFDMIELEDMAKTEVTRDRERALADKLADMKKRARKFVDPLQFALSICSEDLSHYEPVMAHEMGPASKKQLEYIEKAGINPDEVTCSGYASKIIERIKKRRTLNLATPKQVRMLEQKGFNHVGAWSFSDASTMMSSIASNKWRVPHTIQPNEYVPKNLSQPTG